jgi:glycosyltransferase involved in cell wall biosynthesis
MSTYQGEAFVREQIASILQQLPQEGRLVIRDDGSTDATVAEIESIGDRRITVHPGANLGFVRSFLSLLESVPDDTELVMLADQDDVWLPHKIERAWQTISAAGDTPTLYCSRLLLVDAALRPIGLSPLWPRQPTFRNALSENIVTGCTAALNLPAVRLVVRSGNPARIYFHDWWIYLVVAAFGKVVYDPEPSILYRQHGGNAIGMGSGLARYRTIGRFLRRRSWVRIMFDQIENFRVTHVAALAPAQRALLAARFDPNSGRSIARLLLVPGRQRQFLCDEFLLRAMIVMELLRQRGTLVTPLESQA